jgi:hypothetical protein
MSNSWKTGQSEIINYNEILDILKNVSLCADHKIIVGTDSVKLGSEFIFTNAICIINDNTYYDRRFFYKRKKTLSNVYYNLSKRLLRETSESIDIAYNIKKNFKNANVTIHSDINEDSKFKSGKFKNMIIGYVNGCGFDCVIKPNSFVASGIADLYTRKS